MSSNPVADAIKRELRAARLSGVPEPSIVGQPMEYERDVDCLIARMSTLQGRIEALERDRTRRDEREMKIRRAIGQLAAAVGLVAK